MSDERRSRKGWWIVGGVVAVWLFLLAGIAVVAAAGSAFLGTGAEWEEEVVMGSGDQKVVVIDIRGEIHGGSSDPSPLGSEDAGAVDITSQLRQAREDPEVAAVVLRIDSPGGAVVASDEIHREVQRTQEDDIPVVASMADIAASGGYYVAAGADRILANPATLTGSIGVIMIVPNVQGAAEKVGISMAVIKSGRFKDSGSPFRPLEPEERDHFQRLIDEAYEGFVEVVSDGRGIPAAEVKDFADGRIITGQQAEGLGLVDGFGDLDAAYDEALELASLDRDASRLVRYTSSPGLGSLFSPFARSPVEEIKRELGIGFGLKYLYLP